MAFVYTWYKHNHLIGLGSNQFIYYIIHTEALKKPCFLGFKVSEFDNNCLVFGNAENILARLNEISNPIFHHEHIFSRCKVLLLS